jgi:hypothetical protein
LGLNQLGVVVDCQSESMSRHSMFPSRRKDGEVIPSVACRPFSHYNDSIWRYCVVLVAKYRLFQEWRTPNQWPIEFVHLLSLYVSFPFFSSFYRGENGQEDWLWKSLSGPCELFPTST